VSHNAVIIEEFVDHMRPSELKFDKLQLWARVFNLPFNVMRNETWGKAIAKKLDKDASLVQVDPVGGYLRVRITIDVNKPLRRECLLSRPRGEVLIGMKLTTSKSHIFASPVAVWDIQTHSVRRRVTVTVRAICPLGRSCELMTTGRSLVRLKILLERDHIHIVTRMLRITLAQLLNRVQR
jgi:hypothetical protein